MRWRVLDGEAVGVRVVRQRVPQTYVGAVGAEGVADVFVATLDSK